MDDEVNFCMDGGIEFQPDTRLYPLRPDPNAPADDPDRAPPNKGPQSRVVIELKVAHRNADKLREVGHTVLANSHTSLFIGIKVWKMVSARTFGALLVVWGKDHDTNDVTERHTTEQTLKEEEEAPRHNSQEQSRQKTRTSTAAGGEGGRTKAFLSFFFNVLNI
jgi:hypothetical protein